MGALEGSSPTAPATKELAAEMREALLKLQARVQEASKLAISTTTSSESACDKVVKKAIASEVVKKREAVFDKYDKRKKGRLDKAEVTAYAKGEFTFSLSDEVAAKIAGRLAT